jgi:hypothetical protein
MLGLVGEFSQTPYIEGREFISPMRGVLHSGHVCGQENGLLTFEAMKYNRHELPKSFGGMSGGGLWRIYFVENENETKIVATMLCGIASWQTGVIFSIRMSSRQPAFLKLSERRAKLARLLARASTGIVFNEHRRGGRRGVPARL